MKMSSGLVLAGLGLAAIGFGGRLLSRQMPKAAQAFEQTVKSFPASQGSWANSKYYKGGFEPKMSKREAALILGVSPNAQIKKVRECHKKVMLLNHPDRGGSPYIAAKINEAKDLLDK
jgi:DnaJ family protein C protein 19